MIPQKSSPYPPMPDVPLGDELLDCDIAVPRDHILGVAYAITSGARREDYGPPSEQHGLTGRLINECLATRCRATGKETSLTAEDVCAVNVLQKLARYFCGGGTRDTWVDIAGYAANAVECEGGES